MATTAILNVYNDNPTATVFAVNNNNIEGLPGGNSQTGSFTVGPYASATFPMLCTGIEQSWFAIGVQGSGAEWTKFTVGEPDGVTFAGCGNGQNFNLFVAGTTLSQWTQALEGSPVATFQACFGPPTLTVPPIVNSVIQANLPAVLAWLQTSPIFTFGETTVQIQSITPNTTLDCYYGSFGPVPGNSGQANARIMLCLDNATVDLLVTRGVSAAFTLNASPIYIELGAIVSYGPPQNSNQSIAVSVSINSLSVSLPGYSLSGAGVYELGAILTLLYPWLVPAITLGYLTNSSLENVLNGPLNGALISAVQSAINDALASAL